MYKHQRLDVWQESRRFVVRVYELTRAFPKEERFGFTSQLRRAAVSIPSNVAEGAGRGTERSFAHFVRIAAGSASEVETQLLIARDLELASAEELDEAVSDVQRIRKMLWSLGEHYSKSA
ncbi:MAG: four helix bundle protein [Actinomycetota bacterium]